jgi:BON domain
MMAKNVKIITIDGAVTLRGRVETEKEKAAIESHAKSSGGKKDLQRTRNQENPKLRTTTTMSRSIVGIATSTSHVENTLRDLQNNGFVPASDISVLMPDSAGTPELGAVKETKAPEGATAGAATEASSVALWGCWLVLEPWLFPASGRLSPQVPIMAALSGAAAGATAGGVVRCSCRTWNS